MYQTLSRLSVGLGSTSPGIISWALTGMHRARAASSINNLFIVSETNPQLEPEP